MKLKNNIKLHNFKKNKYNTKFSLNNFLELDMFNPLIQKNYFSQYNLNVFKTSQRNNFG